MQQAEGTGKDLPTITGSLEGAAAGPHSPEASAQSPWRPHPLVLLFAVVLVVVGTALACLTASAPPGSSSGPAGRVEQAVAVPGVVVVDPSPRSDQLDAARTLLEARRVAVESGRRDGWVAGLDPVAPGFRAEQEAVFDRIRLLPLRLFRYDVVGVEAASRPAAPAAVFVVHARLRYRLPGDSRDVVREQYVTVIRRGGAWFLSGIDEGRSDAAFWDLGALTVEQGRHCLVVAVGWPAGSDPQLARTAAEVDAAAAEVDHVWGTGGPRSVVVLVPRNRALMAAALGRPDSADLDQVAAVTSGELDRARSHLATSTGAADRVVLNPGPFAKLTGLGRRVVLAHELTHVATRAVALLAPPLWVEEGMANYVAYRDAGLPPGLVAADVLPLVRQGRAPAHLPSTEDFDPAHGPIAPAYADAWLAFQVMGEGHPERPIAFYRLAVGLTGGPTTSEQALDLAFRRVLGTTQDGFEASWRAYRQRLA
ncbi:MAG TPA: hypothetical protein VI248_25175 [Kineosporiaceae bacterium]